MFRLFIAIVLVPFVLLLVACGVNPAPPAAPEIHGRPTAFQAFLRRSDASLIVYTPLSDALDNAGIERELTHLRRKFNGLIIYGFDRQTPLIFETAVALGYQAILATIWDPRSDTEIRAAADLMQQYSDRLILAVSIGSEGLLQQRYAFSDLVSAAAALDRLSDPAHLVEKTTSEPWWRYLDGQPSAGELRGFGDFISVHVHVIWDADIADPAMAARWTRDRAVQIGNLSGRPVFVREAGFPGGGRSPRPTMPGLIFSRDAQAAFWREWLALRSQERPVDEGRSFVSMPAAFEATDNARKTWRDFESTWGLLSSRDLQPYPAWEVFPETVSAPVAR